MIGDIGICGPPDLRWIRPKRLFQKLERWAKQHGTAMAMRFPQRSYFAPLARKLKARGARAHPVFPRPRIFSLPSRSLRRRRRHNARDSDNEPLDPDHRSCAWPLFFAHGRTAVGDGYGVRVRVCFEVAAGDGRTDTFTV